MLPSPMKPTGPSLDSEKQRRRGNDVDVRKSASEMEDLRDKALPTAPRTTAVLCRRTNILASTVVAFL